MNAAVFLAKGLTADAMWRQLRPETAEMVVFVQDLPALPGASAATLASLKVAGKQMPDVPYWVASAGVNWRIGQFTLTPIVHVVGDRMGDTTGRQPVPGYGLLDFAVKYEHPLEWGQTLEAGITVANVFDQRYIGKISNDYFQQFSSSGIYFPGTPRTVVGKVGVKF